MYLFVFIKPILILLNASHTPPHFSYIILFYNSVTHHVHAGLYSKFCGYNFGRISLLLPVGNWSPSRQFRP